MEINKMVQNASVQPTGFHYLEVQFKSITAPYLHNNTSRVNHVSVYLHAEAYSAAASLFGLRVLYNSKRGPYQLLVELYCRTCRRHE